MIYKLLRCKLWINFGLILRSPDTRVKGFAMTFKIKKLYQSDILFIRVAVLSGERYIEYSPLKSYRI